MEAFAKYLTEFKKNNETLAVTIFKILNIIHFIILPPVVLYIVIFTNSLLLLIVFVLIFSLIMLHWEVYGECVFYTIERIFGGDTFKKKQETFKKTFGSIGYTIIAQYIPIIVITIALFRIYYLKTICTRR